MANVEVLFEHVVPGKRLGRHIDRDALKAAKPFSGPLKAVQTVQWTRNIPILNQGDVGSCTGNAATGALGTNPNWFNLPSGHPVLNESEALALYSAAEVIDGDGPYPPNDNGSTGPSVAKAAVNAGLIASFNHYNDINSTLQALQLGPVIVGVSWYTSFDTPAADGTVVIAKGATVRGGHEIVMRSYNADTGMFGLDNSWGTSFGVNGSFQMSVATFTALLAQGGDTTAFVPLAAPPQPTPTPSPEGVQIPGLNGHSAGFAHNALVNRYLVPVAAAGQKATEVVYGTVPKAGTWVAANTRVTILAK